MTGVVIPFWLDRPSGEAAVVARNAEALGFEELWMGELYHYDAFALAGHLVTSTSRITPVIGPIAAGVRDPVSMARGLATVAELGTRPVRLALGASTPAVVERFHGRRHGGEAERMRDTVRAIRTQVRTGRSPTGYRSALARFDPHVTVAAFGPRMVSVAREVADRMVINLVTPAQASRLAAAAGDTPTVAWVVAALEPGEATRGQVAGQVAHYLAAPGYGEMFSDAGFGELVARARDGMPLPELAGAVPEELLMAVAMYGSRSDVESAWRAYRSAGVRVAMVPATADDPGGARVLELLSGSG